MLILGNLFYTWKFYKIIRIEFNIIFIRDSIIKEIF